MATEPKMQRVLKRIGTHNGVFHCDEALACFMLKQLPEYTDAEIIRTRDQKVIKCSILQKFFFFVTNGYFLRYWILVILLWMWDQFMMRRRTDLIITNVVLSRLFPAFYHTLAKKWLSSMLFNI